MKLKLLIVAGLLSFMSPLFMHQTVSAVSGPCFFTSTSGPVGSTGTCSEPGLGDYGTNDVLTGRDSNGKGNAIPSSVNSKSEFINYILSRFNNGVDQDKIGAGFIMQELRGTEQSYPSSADAADWTKRMQQSTVTVSRQWDSKIGDTSWYDNDKKNTFYANHAEVGRWVVEIRFKGKVVAQVEYACGNMVAGPIIIPLMKPPGGGGGAGDFIPSSSVDQADGEPVSEYSWSATATDGFIPTSTWPGQAKTKETAITWLVNRIIYPPTVSTVYPASRKNSNGFICPAGANCQEAWRSNARESPRGTVSTAAQAIIDDLASGSRVCYVSSVYLPPETESTPRWEYWYTETIYKTDSKGKKVVDRYVRHYHNVFYQKYKAESTRTWNHSKEDCLMVAKRPRVRVLGGDVYARGTIDTGTSTFNQGGTFGSWVEYGVFSSGKNDFLASGAAYRNGSSGGKVNWSRLTFANTSGQYGNFGLVPDAPPTIAAYYKAQPKNPWPGNFSTDGVFSAGNIVVSGSNINKSIVIYSTGTVTIGGNLTYNNGLYAANSRIPQVIIIAKNINITSNVTQVDAWLVTTSDGINSTGSINTCSDGPAILTDATCTNELRVNGPVITSKLYLYRTAGAINNTVDKGKPAEIFNFRPDAFLWAQYQARSASIAQTIDLVELPPRF